MSDFGAADAVRETWAPDDDDAGDGLISDDMLKVPWEAPGFETAAVLNRDPDHMDLMHILAKHFNKEVALSKGRRLVHRWSHYWQAHSSKLRDLRRSFQSGRQVNVVEVGGFAGGSAQVWADWFGPGVTVHVLDIADVSRAYLPPNVRVWKGDQSNVSFWRDEFFAQVPEIDALIDDGGHTWLQQVVTLREALPRVRNGGIVIIEDTHTSWFLNGWRNQFHEAELLGRLLRLEALKAGCSEHPRGAALDILSRYGFNGPTKREGEEIHQLVDTLLAETGNGLNSTGGLFLLPAWTFIDECKSLASDMTMFRALESNPSDAGLQAQAKLARAARSVRRSVLDEDWRRWFAGAVESITFEDSIVSFRLRG